MTLRAISLFAGAGSLLLGDWLGWRHVAAVERDAYCRAVLAHRYPDLPLYAEADDTPWEFFRGKVDVVTAGWPCQPHSLAGLRLADADERDGWHHVVAALRGTGARLAFLENVAAVASSDAGSYFGGCLADLAELGLNAEWVVLGARDAGAPHGRKRLWLLAYAGGDGRGERGPAHDDHRRDAPGDDAHRRGAPLADADRGEPERGGVARVVGSAPAGERGEGVQRQRAGDAARHCGAGVADADSARACARSEQHADRSAPQAARPRDGGPLVADAIGARSEAGDDGSRPGAREPRPEPQRRGDDDHGRDGDAAQPALGRGADGMADRLDWPARVGDWPAAPGEEAREWEAPRTCASYPGRVDAIRALGNGWVTAQAVLAWQILAARAGVGP